jgi:tRNA (mo5U34)-methyltransferase
MDLTEFQPFFRRLAATPLKAWRDDLAAATLARVRSGAHGDLADWEAALAALPQIPPSLFFSIDQSPPAPLFLRGEKEMLPLINSTLEKEEIEKPYLEKSPQPPLLKGEKENPPFEKGIIKKPFFEKGIIKNSPFEKSTLEKHPFEKGAKKPPFEKGGLGGFQGVHQHLRETLQRFHPWRKGPFCIHGVTIDTEWRSDWKWNRLADAITPLHGRLVLDVGCGNGYYGGRMLDAGAALVLGIDPTLLFVMQFLAINRYAQRETLAVLPLALEDLPPLLTGFDTVFSMGVLYHRRSPLDHLDALRRLLRPGGELVLETLVIDGDAQQVLVPPGRYAGMRNVWFIPSVAALTRWLTRCGFQRVQVIDVSRTTVEEQRATEWMRFQSLADQLDPTDRHRTREGLPAPVRAVLIAERP